MASEQVANILRAKLGLDDAEIAAMTDAEGWRAIYSAQTPKQEKLPAVCFTGFLPDEKEELKRMAEQAHLRVVSGVSSIVAFLCTGPNAGPAKLKKAVDFNITILNRTQFVNMLETGELPL